MNDQEPIQPSLFLALDISPDSLIEFHDAQNAIEGDQILEEDFVQNDSSIRRCVYFLYGKEDGSEKSRDERVDQNVSGRREWKSRASWPCRLVQCKRQHFLSRG
jgi:hypothetical protein